MPHVQQLINIFENLHNDLRVIEVWFLKKKDKGDGFENFHYDYKNIGGGSNDVSFTVNVNLGKLNEANDIATKNTSPSNERIDKIREGGDDAETISTTTRKTRDQSTTKRRFTLSQVQNAVYKRHRLLHGLPARTR